MRLAVCTCLGRDRNDFRLDEDSPDSPHIIIGPTREAVMRFLPPFEILVHARVQGIWYRKALLGSVSTHTFAFVSYDSA